MLDKLGKLFRRYAAYRRAKPRHSLWQPWPDDKARDEALEALRQQPPF